MIYKSELHRVLAEWMAAHGIESWLWLTQQAGTSPSRGSDITKGARPQLETLRKLATVTETQGAPALTLEDLERAAGYRPYDGYSQIMREIPAMYSPKLQLPKDLTEDELRSVEDYAHYIRDRRVGGRK